MYQLAAGPSVNAFGPDNHRYVVKRLILLRSKLGHSLTLALNRSETMKIMFLAAATLSLGVGAADADNAEADSTRQR